ncbi:MAG: NADH-quinone oxidoreductase subunit NuoN [Lautropia sp.]
MTDTMAHGFNLTAMLPEIVLLIAACVVLLFDAVGSSRDDRARNAARVAANRRAAATATGPMRLSSGSGAAPELDEAMPAAPRAGFPIDRLALIGLGATLLAVWIVSGQGVQYAFGELYVSDALAHVLKGCAIVATGAAIVYGRRYAIDRGIHKGELYALALLALLGQMVMISGANLLVLYLGLELMSLSLYAIAAIRRDSVPATEAAMKYFVLGALASGFLLYGMSMIYGATGSLDIPDIVRKIGDGLVGQSVLVFGVVFLVAGIAFKFGAVPFHMWVPDVYQGTPTVATALIASGPKLATFALAFRLLGDGLLSTSAQWQQMLIVLAVLSLGLGNLAAIAQTNIKRMLAYSAISQIGFVLLGILAAHGGNNPEVAAAGFSGAMFYAITYVLTTIGTFGLIQLIARQGHEAEQLDDFRGLARRSPWLAGVMLAMMFSLTGIPPLVGFYAKLAVLQSVVEAGMVWLAVYAVMMSLIGAYYYLRVVKLMYFDEPVDEAPIAVSGDAKAVMSVNGALVLLLGVLPGPLMTLCLVAVSEALHLG